MSHLLALRDGARTTHVASALPPPCVATFVCQRPRVQAPRARGPSGVYSGRDGIIDRAGRQGGALAHRQLAWLHSGTEARRGMDAVSGGVVSGRQGCGRARCDRYRAERIAGVIQFFFFFPAFSRGRDRLTVQDRSHRFAKVLSTSLKAPFVTLCDYARVPGILAGIWRHLLLLDTTREPGGGGLELLDWHAQTTGTVLLPRLPDLVSGAVASHYPNARSPLPDLVWQIS